MKIDIKGVIIPNDYSWIYDWFEMENTCPNKVNKLIDKANGEDLDIYINSGGGDIFAGSEIYSAIRGYKGKVNMHIVGIAASAASVIACAGHCDIAPTAMMMVHNVSGSASGDYHQMDKSSEVLNQANKTIAAAYVDKTGMTEKEALEMMDKETWLTAEEAVKIKLVDGISGNKNIQLVNSIGCSMIPESVIQHMQTSMMNPKMKAQAQLKLINLRRKEIE